jgi:hypothetical protein
VGFETHTKEQNKSKPPKEELMNIMYVGYFLPEGMRDIFAEDGWRVGNTSSANLARPDPVLSLQIRSRTIQFG